MNNKLKLAIEIARGIQHDKYRMACVVTNKRDRVISVGINSYTKSHPKQLFYAHKSGNNDKIYLHAEISALIRCREKPWAIYIARVNRSGKPKLAKPCRGCEIAIRDANIKRIMYTF